MKVISEIDEARPEIQRLRRDLHAHPELRFEERRTADVVADTLAGWGWAVHRGLGGTGVVGTLTAGRGTRSIGLRADMDALPIDEANAFAHRSVNPGKMHACGHDGHTAMLLGAARYLARHREFDGHVHVIFQPAEEGGAGAKAMIDDGLFERFPMDAVFGMHNWPGMAQGTFGVRTGAIMASSNEFHIRVRGVGTHAAMPHKGHDPVFAALQIAQGLQGAITRVKSPVDAAVLSITRLIAGTAVNVVPDMAELAGTVRTFSEDVLDLLESRMQKIALATAEAHDCEAEFEFKRNYPPTINAPAPTRLAIEVMTDIVGANQVDTDVEPTMSAEDFSFMLQAVPGCYAFIGNGAGGHRDQGHGLGPCTLHNPNYDFNDDILSLGSTYWVNLVTRFLQG